MAIGDKIPVVMGSDLAVPGGVATLDREGKLPAAQRPDYSISQVAGLQDALDEKQGTLAFDAEPTEGSDNPVRSGGVYDALSRKQDTLTGAPGQLIGISGDGTAQAAAYPSNKNLLINYDFTNPVNRNGENTYVGAIYGIDCWKSNNATLTARLTDQGISLESSNPTATCYYRQTFKNNISANKLTLSALVSGIPNKNPTGNASFYLCYSDSTFSPNMFLTGEGLFSETVEIPDGKEVFRVQFNIPAEETIVINAVKLELGPIQTLAHKEGDEWVLNEIPNYAEQYAICAQYSPITGEFVGSQHSNDNILDNAYFGGGQFPINQRGETAYTGTVYTVDRWRNNFSATTTTVKSDCIEIKSPVRSDGGWAFYQTIPDANRYIGRTVTLSMLVKSKSGNNRARVNFGIYNSGGTYLGGNSVIFTEPGLISVTYKNIPGNAGGLRAGLYFDGAAAASDPPDIVEIIAAKLELGSIQTLAHKEGDEWVLNDPPPNYALELAKCQRYYYRSSYLLTTGLLSGGALQYLMFITTPVPLRATPTVSMSGWIGRAATGGYSKYTPNNTQVQPTSLACKFFAENQNFLAVIDTVPNALDTNNQIMQFNIYDLVLDANL